MEALISDGRYPHFTRVLHGMDFDMNLDELFEFGLQRLLDGITATATSQGACALDHIPAASERH